MNISNCMKHAAFLLLSITTLAYPQAETKQPTTNPTQQKAPMMDFGDFQIPEDKLQEVKAALAKIMDGMITNIIQLTSKIEELLEDLSMSVNNNIIGKENKKELLQQIKNIRLVIAGIKKEAFVDADPQTLQFLTLFNESLIEHISESIKDGFKKLPPINDRLAILQKRSKPMDLEQIEKKMLKNEKALIILKNDSQNIGLTWYNHLTRRISYHLLIAHRRQWDKHLLGTVVIGTALAHVIAMCTHLFYTPADRAITKAMELKCEIESCNNVEDVEKQNLINQKKISANLIRTAYKEKGYSDQSISKLKLTTIEGQRSAARRIRSWWSPRGFFGMQPYEHPATKKLVNVDDLTWLGKTHFLTLVAGAYFASWYNPAIGLVYGKNWTSDLTGWAGGHFGSVYAKLIGGVAAKNAAKAKNDDNGMEPRYNFDDVVGLEHIKDILRKILEYLKNPERFDRANIPPERGYLFTGLPGTGKSFVAEAFGGEVRKIFKEIGRDEDELGFYFFKSSFINERGIDYLLDLAKKEAPCVIFIDEIDLLRLQRGNGNSEMLSEFLSSMSGVLSKDSGKQVVLLAATNRPEHLDKALRRRGRFGKIIHFELPTLSERKTFFTKKLEPLIPDLSKIDIDKLAQETEGRTYEELTAMTNSAFQKTKMLGEPLTQKHLEDSLDEEIRHIINNEMCISDQEQEMIAAHQAGHAAASVLLQSRRELAGVTIKPFIAELKDESAYAQYYGPRKQKDVQYGKIFTKCSYDHLMLYSKEEKIKQCKIELAGIIAEKVILGSCGHSYHTNDKQKALDMVKSIVFEGLHIKTMPKELQLEYFQKALKNLKVYEQEIEALLIQHKDALQEIADELKKNKTLSDRRIKEIIVKHNGSEQAAVVAAQLKPALA